MPTTDRNIHNVADRVSVNIHKAHQGRKARETQYEDDRQLVVGDIAMFLSTGELTLEQLTDIQTSLETNGNVSTTIPAPVDPNVALQQEIAELRQQVQDLNAVKTRTDQAVNRLETELRTVRTERDLAKNDQKTAQTALDSATRNLRELRNSKDCADFPDNVTDEAKTTMQVFLRDKAFTGTGSLTPETETFLTIIGVAPPKIEEKKDKAGTGDAKDKAAKMPADDKSTSNPKPKSFGDRVRNSLDKARGKDVNPKTTDPGR